MANPATLQADTTLYSPMEPNGRKFPAGEPWPGDAWSTKLGGEAKGANAAAGALKDLIEANDQIEQLSRQMASKDHDLAVMASERDAATGLVSDLEQRAIAAEAAQKAAEESARNYMLERDAARSEVQGANDRASGAGAAKDEAEGKVADLVAQLAEAHQQIADLTAPPKKSAKAEAAPADATAPA